MCKEEEWERSSDAEDLDDARAVARVRAGDTAAFEAIYHRHSRRVEAYMQVALKCRHEAESATQEVFAKAFEALADFELRGVPLRIWLFRITRNYAINHQEKHRRVSVESPEQIGCRLTEGASGVAESAELAALARFGDRNMLRLLSNLPERQAQVLYLRFMIGMSVSETAEALTIGENAIRNVQYRAFKTLRPRFEALRT